MTIKRKPGHFSQARQGSEDYGAATSIGFAMDHLDWATQVCNFGELSPALQQFVGPLRELRRKLRLNQEDICTIERRGYDDTQAAP